MVSLIDHNLYACLLTKAVPMDLKLRPAGSRSRASASAAAFSRWSRQEKPRRHKTRFASWPGKIVILCRWLWRSWDGQVQAMKRLQSSTWVCRRRNRTDEWSLLLGHSCAPQALASTCTALVPCFRHGRLQNQCEVIMVDRVCVTTGLAAEIGASFGLGRTQRPMAIRSVFTVCIQWVYHSEEYARVGRFVVALSVACYWSID